MTNRDFTSTTAKLHELFLTQDYRNDLISTFRVSRWSDIDDGQRTFGFELVFTLFNIFTAELGSLVKSKQEDEPLQFRVENMGTEGRGKVRYVGGRAIRKNLEKLRRFVLFL